MFLYLLINFVIIFKLVACLLSSYAWLVTDCNTGYFFKLITKSVFPLQFFETYILSHHRIQVPTSLVAKVALIRYYI